MGTSTISFKVTCNSSIQSLIVFFIMPNIKIYYFDFPFWRAEVSRLALHLGNVPFENVKVTFADRDPLKEAGKAPLGAFPTMEVDGKIVCQTGAIARYCGKLGGFYPRDDDFAAAKIDEIIDTATDITNAIGVTMRMKDEQEKLAARKELSTGKLPESLQALETLLTQNGSTGFYVGNKMTIADLAIWRLMGWINGGVLDGIPKEILDPYKQVNGHFKSMEANPQIRAYMKEKYNK